MAELQLSSTGLPSSAPAVLPLALHTPFHSGMGEGSCLNIVPTPLKRYQVNELQTPRPLLFFHSLRLLAASWAAHRQLLHCWHLSP